jgi:hypothetical protein
MDCVNRIVQEEVNGNQLKIAIPKTSKINQILAEMVLI